MTISKSRGSYTDCMDIMDQALEDDRGIRIAQRDFDSANFLRMRVHMARSLDRKTNREIYPVDDFKHNTSVYDPLYCQIRCIAGQWFLYISKRFIDAKLIEKLSTLPEIEFDPAPQVEYQPVRQIEDRSVEVLPPLKRRI